MTITEKKLEEQTSVFYRCSCDNKQTLLSNLYHCPHCSDFRCKLCVTFEIEAYYCSSCLTNVAATEARLYNNRCSKCCQCPVCFNTLAIISSPDREYYFSCGFCCWSSFEIDLLKDRPDKLVSFCLELEKSSSGRQAFSELAQYYKDLSLKSIQTKKHSQRSGSITSTYSSLAFSSKYISSSLTNPKKPTELSVKSDMTTTNEAYWEKIDDGMEKEQMIESFLSFSDTNVNLVPHRKPLKSRLSVRCKTCEHNLVMSELNASSTKFKMKHMAIDTTPSITIRNLPNLVPNVLTPILLTVINPTEHNIEMTFNSVYSTNGTADIATKCFVVGLYNEMADILEEDITETQHFDDDKTKIPWRRGNKLGVFLNVNISDSPAKYIQIIMNISIKDITTGKGHSFVNVLNIVDGC